MRVLPWLTNKLNTVAVSLDHQSYIESKSEGFLLKDSHSKNEYANVFKRKCPFYFKMTENEKVRLEQLVEQLQSEKKFLGFGQSRTDPKDIKLVTAGLIARLSLHTDEDFFSDLETINIYQSSFLHEKDMNAAHGLATNLRYDPSRFDHLNMLLSKNIKPIFEMLYRFPGASLPMQKDLQKLIESIGNIETEILQLQAERENRQFQKLGSLLMTFLKIYDDFNSNSDFKNRISEISREIQNQRATDERTLEDVITNVVNMVRSFQKTLSVVRSKSSSEVTLTVSSIFRSLYLPQAGGDTVAHECAHVIDFKYGISASRIGEYEELKIPEWKRQWSFGENDRQEEFAYSVELYFSRPSVLKVTSPENFKACEALFGYVPPAISNHWFSFIRSVLKKS